MKPIAWTVGAFLLTASSAAAQEARPLTDAAASEVAAFYNLDSTTRVEGETYLAPGTSVEGDLAVVGGPLTLAGFVAGSVFVINGDVVLTPAARVDGSLIVVGGRITGPLTGVAGPVLHYTELLRFRRENGRMVALGPARPSWPGGWVTRYGRADLVVAAEESYNRVEGLPIAFGPRIEVGGANPTVLEALAIYRTRNGFLIHPDDFGHRVQLEQYLGGHRSFAVGATLYNLIDPIERRGLSDVENSLATFITHQDYRDHYGRRGWSAHVRFIGRTRPYQAGIEYRDEEQGSVAPGTPWALLGNDETWRPEPQVAEGALRSVRGWFDWDSRNDRDDPSTGWFLQAEVEQGLEGELTYLGVDPTSPGGALRPVPVGEEFTSITLDARRYYRLGPRTRLGLHGLASGSLDGGALPAQRQHVLGGEGTLPGYRQLKFDCGARSTAPLVDGFYPYYGCDREVLLQAELRYSIFSGIGIGRLLGLDFDLLTTPELVLFADAGRAWTEERSLGERGNAGLKDFVYDAGVGIRAGPLGFYVAVPLSQGGADANFFVRIGPRL